MMREGKDERNAAADKNIGKIAGRKKYAYNSSTIEAAVRGEIIKESLKCRKEIRLSEAELLELQRQAEEMGVKDSQYLRMLITNNPRDYPIIREELYRLNNEINHIGVNINQVVHNNNSGLYSREDKHRLYVMMKQLKNLIQMVLEKL